jgi:hypothetical protein
MSGRGGAVEYVMVPVPEELAAQAMKFVRQLDMRTRASQEATQVDTESAAATMRLLNSRCRTVLSVLAEAAIAGRTNLTIGAVASTLQWTEHETVGVVHELNELVWEAFGPMMMIMPTASSEPTAGMVDWNERNVVLWKALAVAVVAAEEQLARDT